MTIPFLKHKEAMIANGEDEPTGMGKSKEEYDMLDAIADDLMSAVNKRDKSLLRDTLEALCDYVRSEDEEQDEEELK